MPIGGGGKHMRLTKVSGIELDARKIEELAEAIDAESSNMICSLKREAPKAVPISITVTEIKAGILITLLYEIPEPQL